MYYDLEQMAESTIKKSLSRLANKMARREALKRG